MLHANAVTLEITEITSVTITQCEKLQDGESCVLLACAKAVSSKHDCVLKSRSIRPCIPSGER